MVHPENRFVQYIRKNDIGGGGVGMVHLENRFEAPVTKLQNRTESTSYLDE